MNEAVQVSETTEQTGDTLLNPNNVQSQPETTQEAPIPLHDDSEQQDQLNLTTDEHEELERPEDWPEEFWDEEGPDVVGLMQSYKELRTKMSQGKHKAPEGDYELNVVTESGVDVEEPGFQTFLTWAKENGISQGAMEDLAVEIGKSIKSETEAFELDAAQEKAKLGEKAQEKITMVENLIAKAPLSDDERTNLAYSLDSADSINAFIKYHQAITNEGIPITPAVNSGQMTKEELDAAVNDPRWLSDANWRQGIEKRWMEANS